MRCERLSIIPLLASLGGCAYTAGDVADPSNITLKQAVFDVEDAMDEARRRALHRPNIGMYLDEATVVFNLSAKKTETDSLSVTGSLPAAAIGIPISATGSASAVSEGVRGNTITLTFKNAGLIKRAPTNAAAIAAATAQCNALTDTAAKKACLDKVPKPVGGSDGVPREIFKDKNADR